MKPAVAYIRVSTARQGRSGLGLEAQQAAIQRFCETEGFEIVREHIGACRDAEIHELVSVLREVRGRAAA